MPIELKGTLKPGEADRRYYMIRVQVHGRRVVVSSGTRVEREALKKESALIEALRENPHMTQAEVVAKVSGEGSYRHRSTLAKDNGVTLRAAFNRCLEAPELWGGIKGKKDYLRSANHLCELLGENTPLAAIDSTIISELVKTLTTHTITRKDGREIKRAGNTVNFYLAVLRSMFNIVATGNWPNAPSLFPKVPNVPKRDQREFYLTPETEAALLDALDAFDAVPTSAPEGRARKRDGHRYRELFLALLEGGLRVHEGLRIRWPDVRWPPQGTSYEDDYQGHIVLGRADEIKRGKRRSVPMTSTLRRLLEAVKERKGGPFADLNYKRANNLWVKARQAAGIDDKDCVIHCTRHTCASRLLEGGANLMEVQAWLGHSSITMTQRYVHLAQHQLVGAAKKMSRLRGGTG